MSAILTHASNWMKRAKRLVRLERMHLRLDDTRRDCVHPNAAVRIFDGERSGNGAQAAFRQCGERRRQSRIRMGDQAGRDLHDMAAAAFLHLGDGELRDSEKSGDVDAQHRGEIIAGVAGERLGDKDAGVVDERVDPPEAIHSCGDDALGRLGIRDIAGYGQNVVIIRPVNRTRRCDDPVSQPPISFDESRTDTARRTGDDCDFLFVAQSNSPSGCSVSIHFECNRRDERKAARNRLYDGVVDTFGLVRATSCSRA